MPVVTFPPASGTWHQALNTSGGGGDITESVVNAGDEIEAITDENDGKFVHFINNNGNADFAAFSVNFNVGPTIPVGSIINSIQFVINHQYVGTSNVTVPSVWDSAQADPDFSASWPEDATNSGTFAQYDQQGPAPGNPMPGGGVFVQWEATATMVPLDTDRGYYPFTSLPWTRDDIIAAYFGTFFGLNGNPEEYNIDYVALIVDYTPSTAPTATLDQLPVEIVYDFSLLADLPFVCALASGTLPDGVTLNPDCTLTGTPTTTGTTPVVVIVTGPGWPTLVPVDIPTVAGVPIDLPVIPPDDPTSGGGGIPHGPGECAGVAYGIGVVTPGGTAGTGDPLSTVSIDLKQFFGGATNAPPPLGFLYAYFAGSSTPCDTFANSALSSPNTNPVELDADGNPPNVIYLGPFIYKFDLQDADHVSLPGFPIDNIAGSVWPGQVLGAVTVNPAANADGIGHSLAATLNKAASGTHALFAGLKVQAPTIGAGSATLTEAATVYIAGPPLGGTTRYAVHIAQGDVLITDSASNIGFYGHTPVAQQILATGTGKTVDNVISALQALGLVKQS